MRSLHQLQQSLSQSYLLQINPIGDFQNFLKNNPRVRSLFVSHGVERRPGVKMLLVLNSNVC